MIKLNIVKVNKFFLFLGASIFIMSTLTTNVFTAGKTPLLRVGIFLNQKEVSISGNGAYKIYNLKSDSLISKENNKIIKMLPHAKGIKILGEGIYSGPIKVVPVGNVNIAVIVNGNKYRYRGNIEIVYDKNCGKLNIINIIGIEKYLYGVLKKEISPRWPMNTLKAQAIAARTFAIFNINKYIDKGYNLDASTNSQSYGGINHEDPLTNKAIDETRGKIMVYKGKPINAVYHSDSGGYTADSESVWGKHLPYLRGVESKFEELVSPSHHTWSYSIDEEDLVRKLQNRGYDINSIISIKLAKEGESERVSKIGFVSGGNGINYMESKDFRELIGSNLIRSTIFSVDIIGKKSGLEEKGEVIVDNTDKEQKKPVIDILEEKEDWTIKELIALMKERKKEKEKEEEKEKDTSKKIKEVISLSSPLTFVFSGLGNGHGVGMSQWGAYGMALQGNSYKDILNYYYQGISIIKKY
ncbi:MAG: SpoIID/LytB domain-containing protein [Candidatus Caldatribacteriota bacterium]|nr:SpoIID/LytB domain-containing protein [Candidatus Caldatribacteriota bacterium]